MSILIKGMKMPEYRDVFGDERGCVYLLMLTVNKDGTAFMQFNDVDGGFYQVKEIPTPHGRLIAADEIEKCVHEWYDVGEYVFADTIRNADTIIEAEGIQREMLDK